MKGTYKRQSVKMSQISSEILFLEALPLILENKFQILSAREGKKAMKKDNLCQAPP